MEPEANSLLSVDTTTCAAMQMCMRSQRNSMEANPFSFRSHWYEICGGCWSLIKCFDWTSSGTASISERYVWFDHNCSEPKQRLDTFFPISSSNIECGDKECTIHNECRTQKEYDCQTRGMANRSSGTFGARVHRDFLASGDNGA
eukprot:scaffold19_cov114-Cylindrotheca_fusiformis.AAC.46